MNKSQFAEAENEKKLVTATDIGRIVDITNIGKGFLRYVGPVDGKDGLFCGVELHEPNGKHDGTHQGVSYFICTPQHGIFAPIFRVQLEEDGGKVVKKTGSKQNLERLSRSALPALQLKNPLTTSVYEPRVATATQPINIKQTTTTTTDPMQMSIFSDMMDGSMFSNGSWSDVQDSMIMSNCTFTVRHGPIDDTDDVDLLSMPVVTSSLLNIDREALKREEQEQMRKEAENLPPIEELETPLVEVRPLPSELATPTPSVPEPPPTEPEPIKESPPKPPREQKTPAQPASIPPTPKFPVKPKAPSKHQLMMEQLKASMEAEKNKPKREVKSKVVTAPPPMATPRREEKAMEKKPLAKTKPKTIVPPPTVERPKKERKPLYVAPPPKERAEKPEKKEKPPVVSKATEKKDFPTSSFAGVAPKGHQKTPSVAGSTASTSKTTTRTVAKAKKPLEEPLKLARLVTACKTLEVFSVMLGVRETNLCKLKTELEQERKARDESESRHRDAIQAKDDELARLSMNMEHVNQRNAETLNRVRKEADKTLAEKTKELEQNLEDEKAKNEAEMTAICSRHQKVVAALDEKMAEAEKLCDQLKADKLALQTALSNDSDQRNQMLTKEISSLQTALELKSAEMKELRQKNQNLSLLVDEIPLKELEISKWKHKAGEFKQQLDQKLTGEKILVQQIEDLRRRQLHDEEEKDCMRKSMDLMSYRFENGDLPTESDARLAIHPKVNFRPKSSTSGHMSAEMRLSTCSSHSDTDNLMSRSTLSMYTSQVRLPENHADDVIYAPDEILSSRNGCISQRIPTSLEEETEERAKSESFKQSDSGIGIE